MKRTRHKVKRETPQTSTYRHREEEERDLAYYIHDRVELMHQVFSAIKPKDLKAMVPECVQHISMDDLKELCTEELLGISSKRLCAILDGAEPPTDTESSSSEHLETISLDSISSDDEILSQPSTKKKHKHKKHKSRSKHKHKNSKDSSQEEKEDEDRSKASRAGLTVLELLELQARARAIRAQLQQDNANMPKETKSNQVTHNCDSSDEVEIKEEPADVVEISSEDEKPKLDDLLVKPPAQSEEVEQTQNPKAITKQVNELTITVPQSTQRKIKLKRNKPVTTCNNVQLPKESSGNGSSAKANDTPAKPTNMSAVETNKQQSQSSNSKSKQKKKQKKKDKKPDKEGSDHDEITLQLSDTEKMDLLENLDRKNYENFTSSSEDSESSSETDSEDISKESEIVTEGKNENPINEKIILNDKENITSGNDTSISISDTIFTAENNENEKIHTEDKKQTAEIELEKNIVLESVSENQGETTEVTNEGSNVEIITFKHHKEDNSSANQEKTQITSESDKFQNDMGKLLSEPINVNKDKESTGETKEKNEHLAPDGIDVRKESIEEGEIVNNLDKSKDLSEGEITDHEGEIVPSKIGTDVVCISDEEGEKRKKKKKKDKKSKKEKKSKKSKSDFRDTSDQNFFTQNAKNDTVVDKQTTEHQVNLVDDDDDIYEILEISDDSSCYEVEGLSVSKVPTTSELEALSAKIDELHTEDIIVINEEETIDKTLEGTHEEDNISWRDRYLGSTKVKRVLTTANILNALRKKNKELKKKLEESNKTDEIEEDKAPTTEVSDFVEGSIDHFNTLEGSTKYVDPVLEDNPEGKEVKEVTKEMGKDAKQLLKMYKRLLKYNDMNRKRDPNKKKKKHKKGKDKEATTKDK